ATENPSVDDYLDWARKQNDHIYKLKFEQRIELYSDISRSGYSNQHQGLDAILKEINKYLKALIPPVPSQKHWRIALRHTLFKMIRHADNKSSGGQIHPDCTLESQRFRVHMHQTGFPNLQDDNRTFKSLGEEHLLSEKLKNFSNLACERQIMFINETFRGSEPNSSPRPIPITAQEEAAAMDEKNMTKKELLAIINSLLNSINISDRPKYRRLQQKTNNELLEILQSIRDLHNNQNELENEIELEN
ncbi:13328_t:CDS:2, partial [Dentiscutata heterogama]